MIERVNWSDDYLLGIPEIDLQHKKLIEIANELYDISIESPEKYKTQMMELIKKLVDYTVYHFSNEENMLVKYNYAGADIHKTAHDGFIKEVKYNLDKLDESDYEAGVRFYSYIANWVLMHIAKADKIWARFVLPKI